MFPPKDLSNASLARLLRAVSAALSLSPGDNRFRTVAYDRAADAIEHASSEIKDLWDDHQLSQVPGIGEGIASHLDELFRTGKSRHFNQILKPFPPALFVLLDVPGIGAKTAYKLTEALGITKAHTALTLLEKAAKKGRIRQIPTFGEQSEQEILQSLSEFRNRSHRLLLPAAQLIADEVIAWLQKLPQVTAIDSLGSLRRQAATVGDIDISVATADAPAVIAHFLKYPKAARTLDSGTHAASILLTNHYQVDIKVQTPESYGSLLQHFTGSKHHNIALRELALKQGYSLSEYGIKIMDKKKFPSLKLREGLGVSYEKENHLCKFTSETSFYNFLGLQYIPPEMREDTGEIALAQKSQLPDLVTVSDIKGDLQIHSDIDVEPSHDLGTSSIIDLVTHAQALGYEYIGFTEHNPSVSNHTPERIVQIIKNKTRIIEQFNYTQGYLKNKRVPFVFNGMELDILADGSLPVPDAGLDLLDYTCVSIHSSFRQPRKQITQRVLKALAHPKVRFFAHPTGRLLQEREGADLDWDAIFAFCLEHDKWLEIDAWPNRLDLPDSLVREAMKKGVKLVIDTDSHDASHLDYMRFGVSVARRGWVTASAIINTQSLSKVQKLLQRR